MKNSGPVSREAANVAVGDRNRKRRALIGGTGDSS
jgi:hypothetical protein